MGDVVPFRRHPVASTRIERTLTRDLLVDRPNGSWSTVRQAPPGYGWEIDEDGERWTSWRRVTL